MNGKKANINMKIDAELKNNAEILLENMGLTLTSAFNILLKEIVRTGRYPFVPTASITISENKRREDIKQLSLFAPVSQVKIMQNQQTNDQDFNSWLSGTK